MKTRIQFSVEGSVTQDIEILNGETSDVIIRKLKSGEYVTTVQGDEQTIERTKDGEKIANITNQDLETEYFDFEEI